MKLNKIFILIYFIIIFYFVPSKIFAQITPEKDNPIFIQDLPKYDLKIAKKITKPKDYINFINNLDKDNIYSISVAVKILDEQEFSTNGFDEIYFQFVDFYYTILSKTYENIIAKVEGQLWEYPDSLIDIDVKEVKEKRVKNFIKLLDENYCTLCSTEGGYFICEKNDALRNIFANKVSPSISEFLKIREKEMHKQFFEDATLVISFKELGERIVTWEDFLNKYKEDKIKDEADRYHKIYLSTFLIGFNNEPTIEYDYSESKPIGLESEVEKAYAYIIQTYPKTKVAALLKEYMALLKEKNYDISKLKDFFKSKDIIETRAIQWFHK
ncbi:MAG: hypothetical protein ACMUJM_24575 [bacterium]